MSATSAALGQKGRLVIPAEVRRKHKWEEGDRLVFVDTDAGVVLMGRHELRHYVRAQLKGDSLVDELLADRKRNASEENAGDR